MKSLKLVVFALLVCSTHSVVFGQVSQTPVTTQQGQLAAYYGQAGVFANEMNAFSLATYIEAIDNSHPVKIVPTETEQGLRYYVIIDEFYNHEEMRRCSMKLKMRIIFKKRLPNDKLMPKQKRD